MYGECVYLCMGNVYTSTLFMKILSFSVKDNFLLKNSHVFHGRRPNSMDLSELIGGIIIVTKKR